MSPMIATDTAIPSASRQDLAAMNGIALPTAANTAIAAASTRQTGIAAGSTRRSDMYVRSRLMAMQIIVPPRVGAVGLGVHRVGRIRRVGAPPILLHTHINRCPHSHGRNAF